MISSRSSVPYFLSRPNMALSFIQLTGSKTLRMLGFSAIIVSPASSTSAIHAPNPLVTHAINLKVQTFCFQLMKLEIISLFGDCPAICSSIFGPKHPASAIAIFTAFRPSCRSSNVYMFIIVSFPLRRCRTPARLYVLRRGLSRSPRSGTSRCN